MSRDLAEVHRAFVEWWTTHGDNDEQGAIDAELVSHTGGGYSNEVFFVTLRREPARRLVLRLAPVGPSLFPTYDLAMQVAVQAAVAGHGVAVPHPILLEPDERWLGAPFLVMPLIEGHDPGQLPVADPWVAAASVDQQRTMHEEFLASVARIHATPWRDRPVAHQLRGANATLLDEVAWWTDLAAWMFDGAPPQALVEAFAWCRANCPTQAPEPTLLWGDVRLGNVVFDDAFAPAAVLDWEMASIGPPELDIAWHTALETMTEHFFQQRVPGFLTRDEVVTRHEQALGRPLVAFRWFEVFAMCRSTAVNLRAERLESARRGKPPRPAERNAVLAYTTDAIAALG